MEISNNPGRDSHCTEERLCFCFRLDDVTFQDPQTHFLLWLLRHPSLITVTFIETQHMTNSLAVPTFVHRWQPSSPYYQPIRERMLQHDVSSRQYHNANNEEVWEIMTTLPWHSHDPPKTVIFEFLYNMDALRHFTLQFTVTLQFDRGTQTHPVNKIMKGLGSSEYLHCSWPTSVCCLWYCK